MKNNYKDDILINGMVGEIQYNLFEKDIDNLVEKYGKLFVVNELIEKTRKGMNLEDAIYSTKEGSCMQ
ncbi:hypothetical protein FDA77_00935 [Clostridium botulinum]|nr:hypothetical protein [Clostridium botulinum]NFJ88514.1 hypothetical protein [Clostridium botulinum]HDI3121670.1 hypothetical protein [Clostridium botulinum]